MDRFPMTPGGLVKLQEELRRLKSDERPAIIRAIAEARAHGDLSENAEYHAAKERQSFVEGRIAAASRAEFGKLRDVELYRQLRDGGAFDYPSMPEPSARVDTSELSPEAAVDSIVAQLCERGIITKEGSEVEGD